MRNAFWVEKYIGAGATVEPFIISNRNGAKYKLVRARLWEKNKMVVIARYNLA